MKTRLTINAEIIRKTKFRCEYFVVDKYLKSGIATYATICEAVSDIIVLP